MGPGLYTSWVHASRLDKYTMSEDFDDNLADYCYVFAFCQAEVATLKIYIESVHPDDLFKFPCKTCGFNAEGPRFLREHVATTHDVDNILSVATVAIVHRPSLEGREVVSFEVVSQLEWDSFDDETTPSTRNHILAPDGLRPLPGTSGRSMENKDDYKKALEDATEKVRVAEECCGLVDRDLRKLDEELYKFKMILEAENCGITEALEKREDATDPPQAAGAKNPGN